MKEWKENCGIVGAKDARLRLAGETGPAAPGHARTAPYTACLE